MGLPRDPTEYRDQLAIQLRHLRRSAEHYDRGDESEALRIAVVIRNLVRDTRQSTSLLTHLNVKGSLRYLDTRPRVDPGWPPGTIMLHGGLTTMKFKLGPNAEGRFAPTLGDLSPDRIHPPVEFEEWWETPVLTDTEGHAFTRADFVRGVADQDGGAHIDATLAPAYGALTRTGSLGIQLVDSGAMHHFGQGLARANVRQIGWELDETLRRDGPTVGLYVD